MSRRLMWGVALGTLAIILGGTLYKVSAVSGGGGSVAKLLGGRLVNSDTGDEDERKLLNVVEEMAIASGTPVPEVYVLEQEESINAFAAGHSTNDAAIGVTRGCMRLLNRDELQGVIGHEFSHILNGDMRLNVRLIGIVHGILCIAILGRILLQTGSSRSSSTPNQQRPANWVSSQRPSASSWSGEAMRFGQAIARQSSRAWPLSSLKRSA